MYERVHLMYEGAFLKDYSVRGSGLEVSNTGFHVVKQLFDLVTRNFTAELFIALDEYALLLPCVNTRKVGSVDNA